MKVKKSEKTRLPKYPSCRQFAESRMLAGLATLGLTAMTGLGDPASRGEAPIVLGAVKGARIAVMPTQSKSETTNNPPPIQRTGGRMLTEPRPHLPGEMLQPRPAATNNQGRITYYVKQGDTLSGLAKEFLGDGSRWKEITVINPGLKAETLKADQIIMIPAKKSNSSTTKE